MIETISMERYLAEVSRSADLARALKAIGNLARLSGISGSDKDTLSRIQREVRLALKDEEDYR